jgi:hypothetical protein
MRPPNALALSCDEYFERFLRELGSAAKDQQLDEAGF